ncbi:hypothetical protein M0R45_006673 [Rubus argutus]|uniref:Uncharacterized protein n=1 Tax=Rubus argutus TaxID=59490 RepID=A0AAW1YR64_RUBAR
MGSRLRGLSTRGIDGEKGQKRLGFFRHRCGLGKMVTAAAEWVDAATRRSEYMGRCRLSWNTELGSSMATVTGTVRRRCSWAMGGGELNDVG